MLTSFDNTGLLKVLNFLKTHESEYLSGQDLSDVLKISRVAVWKHVKKIRSLGYKIESKQKRGYKFVNTTDKLLPWEISKKLKTNFIGKRIYYFDEIDSTQNFALNISSQNIENGTIVLAEKQVNGIGRLNRKWHSPKGGIWFSIIILPEFEISDATIIPIASSLALCTTIEKIHGVSSKVKWPNDITINGKKVAGMLVDATIQANKIEKIVLGVGINFKIDISKIEKKIKNTQNYYGITSLVSSQSKMKQIELFTEFLLELEKVIQDLTDGKKDKIVKKWSRHTDIFGKQISIKTNKGKITGIATKIDLDGALIIKTNGSNKKIFVGDVIIE